MTALTTKLNTRSADFQANAAAMRGLVDDLRAQFAKVEAGGGDAARSKHTARGKLLPRDRVAQLLDPGTPFLEVAPLAAHAMYHGAAPGAGLIAGIGRVSGVDCMIVCNDATVKGGTYYPMTVKKHLRAHVGLVVEDAAEVLAIREHLVLVRQVGAARVDEVDAGQAVLLGDLLRAQVLLDGHRVVGCLLYTSPSPRD